MNTPNKLTVLRVILVPFFLALLMINQIPHRFLFALLVFAAASFTDMLDGHLARKNNQVTTFGKFLDPLADKILVLSAMICFIELGYASSVAVVIIIAREFMVTSLRLVAVSSNGRVIAASWIGKLKTVIQMLSVISILMLCTVDQFVPLPAWLEIGAVSHTLMWISAVITIISGVDYIWKNWDTVSETR